MLNLSLKFHIQVIKLSRNNREVIRTSPLLPRTMSWTGKRAAASAAADSAEVCVALHVKTAESVSLCATSGAVVERLALLV